MFKFTQFLVVVLLTLMSSNAFAATNTLTWTNGVDARITGTRIERKLGTCTTTGTWEKIGSVVAGVSQYSDSSVFEGQTYAYRVRHAAEEGVFSVFSNCVSRTVPSAVLPAPAAPSNLRVN